ncbi:MAG: hypothetical protein WCD79_01940 [Chthoniobacteraceae bacterium]
MRCVLAVLLMFVWCVGVVAGERQGVQTVTMLATVRFVVEQNGVGQISGSIKRTYLVLPMEGLDSRIPWSKEISGRMVRRPPVELEEGRRYEFVVKRSVDADGVEHVREVTVGGVVIFSDKWR